MSVRIRTAVLFGWLGRRRRNEWPVDDAGWAKSARRCAGEKGRQSRLLIVKRIAAAARRRKTIRGRVVRYGPLTVGKSSRLERRSASVPMSS
jgi:hypothetical protein